MWKADRGFQLDCLIYTLFHGQNRITCKGSGGAGGPPAEEHGGASAATAGEAPAPRHSSLVSRNSSLGGGAAAANHWIPLSESEVGARDRFASHFMHGFLAAAMECGTAATSADRPKTGRPEVGPYQRVAVDFPVGPDRRAGRNIAPAQGLLFAEESAAPYGAAASGGAGGPPAGAELGFGFSFVDNSGHLGFVDNQKESKSNCPQTSANPNCPQMQMGGYAALSPEAAAVLDAGRALWRHYHAQPGSLPDASLFDIRAHFQGFKPGGHMNADSPDKTYTSLLATLRAARKALAARIAPKVREHGFLR